MNLHCNIACSRWIISLVNFQEQTIQIITLHFSQGEFYTWLIQDLLNTASSCSNFLWGSVFFLLNRYWNKSSRLAWKIVVGLKPKSSQSNNSLSDNKILSSYADRLFLCCITVRGMMYYKRALILQAAEEGAFKTDFLGLHLSIISHVIPSACS